jgi:hypothetical protein
VLGRWIDFHPGQHDWLELWNRVVRGHHSRLQETAATKQATCGFAAKITNKNLMVLIPTFRGWDKSDFVKRKHGRGQMYILDNRNQTR